MVVVFILTREMMMGLPQWSYNVTVPHNGFWGWFFFVRNTGWWLIDRVKTFSTVSQKNKREMNLQHHGYLIKHTYYLYQRPNLILSLHWICERDYTTTFIKVKSGANWISFSLGWSELNLRWKLFKRFESLKFIFTSPSDKISGRLWRRIKNRRRQIR